MPELGLDLAWRLDGLSILYVLLILGVGLPIQLFAASYLKGSGKNARYWPPLALFALSMLGLVVADNLLLLFLFWELTSVSSFLLIGMDRERLTSRYGALMSLIITAGGGLFLLAGILVLHSITGTYSISTILSQAAQFSEDPRMSLAFLLFFVGAITKSAQFPFHFWLPNAMAAPAPVSAYLHSATMVKAGVYLMLRFYPLFAVNEWWTPLLLGVGSASFLWGIWVSFHKTDLKALLANTSISGLGLLFVGLGIGTEAALTATLVFLVAHAFYKAPLFLIAGAIEKKLGTRDLRELSAVGTQMPLTALAAILAGMSMAGVPLFLGFLAKEEFLVAGLEFSSFSLGVLILGSIFTVAVSLRVCYQVFFEGEKKELKHLPVLFNAMPLLLSVLGLLISVFPEQLSLWIIDPALEAVGSSSTASELSHWHGFGLPLTISFVVLVVGFLTFKLRHFIHNMGTRHFFEGDFAYELFLRGSLGFGRRLTRWMQTGSLPYYVLVSTLSAVLLLVWQLESLLITSGPIGEVSIAHFTVLLLIISSAVLCCFAKTTMASILFLGVAGFSVALMFGLYGAPDLAMTQFSVECLALLLFVLCLRDLPAYSPLTGRKMRVLQILVAGASGLCFAYMSWINLFRQAESKLSPFFAEESLKTAHGHNVVNVILVDFRGLDTMGEITVLGIAALGVVVLLGGFRFFGKGGA